LEWSEGGFGFCKEIELVVAWDLDVACEGKSKRKAG
jgi:hypothetical protein